MSFRNKFHMYLPDEPNTGQPANGDGAAGGAGAPPPNNTGTPPQNDAGGSNGSGGGGDTTSNSGGPDSGSQDISSLPEGWQKHIRDLRTENQTRRQNEQSLTQDRDKFKGFYDSIHGVVNPSEQRDPTQLAQDVSAARQAQQESDRKLAIYQLAGQHGADPTALLDSASFLGTVRDLDPTSSEFSSTMGERIKTAVENNGRLKARSQNGGNGQQQRPGSSGSTEFPGGAGGNQLTRDDLKTMSPENIEKARVEGRLKSLLGG